MILAVLSLGGIAYALLQSLVVPALPQIQDSLHTSESSVGWVLTAFLLSASVTTPIVGRLGDMYGKERLLMIVLVLLAHRHLISAVASSLAVMLVGRVIQGVGGGIFPLAFSIIRDELPRERVPGGIGLVSSLLGIGGGAGVVLAGVVTENLSYHWLFWFPLGDDRDHGAAHQALHPRVARQDAGPGQLPRRRPDDRSASRRRCWRSPRPAPGAGARRRRLACSPSACSLIGAWVREELRSREPLVDMRMMAIRGVWTTNTVAFLIGVGMYSSFILLPEFVQEPASTGYGFAASATAAGLFLLPATIAITVVGQIAGVLERRIGSRGAADRRDRCSRSRRTRCSCSAAAPRSTSTSPPACSGSGSGSPFSAMANLIVENVRQEQTGVATGMNAVTRTLGGAFGGQLAATLLAGNLARRRTARPTTASSSRSRCAWWRWSPRSASRSSVPRRRRPAKLTRPSATPRPEPVAELERVAA